MASTNLLLEHLPRSSETGSKSIFCGTGKHEPLGTVRGSNSTSRRGFGVPEDLARLLEEPSVSVPGCPVSHRGGFLDAFWPGFSPTKQGKT